MYNTLSFFSGAMGLDMGLEQAGFKIVSCCENEKNARETIRINRPEVVLLDDILSLTVEGILSSIHLEKKDVFLICGGPPCQAFSTAGKRRSFDDPRENAFLKYLDIATQIHPLLLSSKMYVVFYQHPMLQTSNMHRHFILSMTIWCNMDISYLFSCTIQPIMECHNVVNVLCYLLRVAVLAQFHPFDQLIPNQSGRHWRMH